MSAWERSRRIPWSTIVQDDDPSQNAPSSPPTSTTDADPSSAATAASDVAADPDPDPAARAAPVKNVFGSTRSFDAGDLFREVAFGISVGSVTGAVFGFIDSLNQSYSSKVLRDASGGAKVKFLMDGSVRAGATFGGFFGSYHVAKYGVRTVLDPGDFGAIFLSGAASLGVVTYRPNLRMYLPYAGMMVAMDVFHLISREMGGEKKKD